MSNPSVVTLQLAASSANGIALSQTPVAAGALTLNGASVSGGVATLDAPRRILVSTAGADVARTFTIVGTGRAATGAPFNAGPAITEAVTAIPNTTSKFTKLDFATVTSVTVDAATAGAITVGTNGTGSTVWVVDDFERANWNLVVAVSIVSGSVTYTVEHTYDDPNDVGTSLTAAPQQFSMEPASYIPPLAWPDTTLNALSVNGETTFPGQPIFAHRLTITNGTGQAVMQSIQGGNAGY